MSVTILSSVRRFPFGSVQRPFSSVPAERFDPEGHYTVSFFAKVVAASPGLLSGLMALTTAICAMRGEARRRGSGTATTGTAVGSGGGGGEAPSSRRRRRRRRKASGAQASQCLHGFPLFVRSSGCEGPGPVGSDRGWGPGPDWRHGVSSTGLPCRRTARRARGRAAGRTGDPLPPARQSTKSPSVPPGSWGCRGAVPPGGGPRGPAGPTGFRRRGFPAPRGGRGGGPGSGGGFGGPSPPGAGGAPALSPNGGVGPPGQQREILDRDHRMSS